MSDSSFLYPFLNEGQREAGELLDDLARSADAKIVESQRLSKTTLSENHEVVEVAAAAIAERVHHGARLMTIGNGGSACDALAFVRRLDGFVAARSLAADPAVLTALGNDIGVDKVFSRQVEAFGRHDDVAVAFSTSGQSPNVLEALSVARKIGMLTIGVAGYDGGSMSSNDNVDHCLVVRSTSVHRIQEAQAALAERLCSRIEERLAEGRRST